MTSTKGLTSRKMRIFNESLIMANNVQLPRMLTKIKKEMVKRGIY